MCPFHVSCLRLGLTQRKPLKEGSWKTTFLFWDDFFEGAMLGATKEGNEKSAVNANAIYRQL